MILVSVKFLAQQHLLLPVDQDISESQPWVSRGLRLYCVLSIWMAVDYKRDLISIFYQNLSQIYFFLSSTKKDLCQWSNLRSDYSFIQLISSSFFSAPNVSSFDFCGATLVPCVCRISFFYVAVSVVKGTSEQHLFIFFDNTFQIRHYQLFFFHWLYLPLIIRYVLITLSIIRYILIVLSIIHYILIVLLIIDYVLIALSIICHVLIALSMICSILIALSIIRYVLLPYRLLVIFVLPYRLFIMFLLPYRLFVMFLFHYRLFIIFLLPYRLFIMFLLIIDDSLYSY